MAFGTAVTDIDQSAIGSYGYTIKIDTTLLLFYSVSGIQAQPSAISTPEPTTGEETLDAILGYLNDANCPDLAYNFSNGELTIFFKTSVFAYVVATRYAIFGIRNPQKATVDGDFLDFPDRDRRLVVNYALKEAYEIIKGKATREIEQAVELEELRIRNE